LCRLERGQQEEVYFGEAMVADPTLWRTAACSRRGYLSGEVEAFELEEVEGMDVPEHDCLDLLPAAHQDLSEAMVAHVSVRPFRGKRLR